MPWPDEDDRALEYTDVGGGIISTSPFTFTPANLSGLLAWYKADVGVFSDAGITPAVNGSAVKQWNDQSGNGVNLTVTSTGNEPIYRTGASGLNGLPILDNNSGSQLGIRTTGKPLPFSSTVVSAFILINVSSASNGRMISTANSLGDHGSNCFTFECNSTTLNTYSGQNNGVLLSNGTTAFSVWGQFGTIFDGVNNTTYINNVAQTAVASTPTFAVTQDLGIGCTADTQTNNPSGFFAEVVLTQSVMSSSDRNNLHTYLFSKWGI